jgi:hypothetical protein
MDIRLCLGETELLIRFSDFMILGRMKSVRNTNEDESCGRHTCKESTSLQAAQASCYHLALWFIVQK